MNVTGMVVGEVATRLGAMSQDRRSYTLRQLPTHLAEAGDPERLKQLLTTFGFLQAKVDELGPQLLIKDYDLFPGVALGGQHASRDNGLIADVQSAIRLSAHIVRQTPSELGGQLLGRLMAHRSPLVQLLLDGAKRQTGEARLRPVRPSLVAPGPLLRTLSGHTDYVGCLAITPDGRRLVSGSNDNSVRVWDVESGVELHALFGHRNWVKAVAITPDGQLVISGSFDNTVRIWDLDTPESPTVIRVATQVTSIALLPDGRRFVAAVGSKLQIRHLPDGSLDRALRRGRNQIWSVIVTPDGQKLITVSTDGMLRIRHVDRDDRPEVLRGHDFEMKRYVTVSDGVGSRSFRLDFEIYSTPAVSPNGRTVFAATGEHTIRMRDAETKAETGKLVGHENTINAVAVAPDGRTAISGADDNTIRVWDLETRKLVRTLHGHSSGVTDVAFAKDGAIAVSASGDGTLRVWDLGDQRVEIPPAHQRGVAAVLATPGRFVSASEWDETATIKIWDRRGILVRSIVTEESIEALAVTPDWRWLVLAGMGIYMCTLRGKPHIRYLGGDRGSGHSLSALAITPDGRYLVDAGWEGARLWDLATLDLTEHRNIASTASPRDLDLFTFWLATSPDGRWLLGSCKGGIRVVPIGHPAERRTLEEEDIPIRPAVFAPDGATFLGRTYSGKLKLWDFHTLQCLRIIDEDLGYPVYVTSDGGRVISYGGNVVQYRDLTTGNVLASFTGEGPITACAVSPDGSCVIAGESTGRVHILRLEHGPLQLPVGKSVFVRRHAGVNVGG